MILGHRLFIEADITEFEMLNGVSDGMSVCPHSLRHRERGAGPRFQRILY